MHAVFAYIDAGSGSLIIQALIAGIVAAPFVLRQQIGRLVRRLRGQPEPGPSGSVPAAPTDVDPAG
jgi:hypothetical protein